MSKDFEATITHPVRVKLFEEVFGRNTVYITSPVAQDVWIEGVGEARAYMLDMKLVTPVEFDRLVAALARRFGASPEEVAATIGRDGVPILERNCRVVVHNPTRWFV